MSILQQTAQLTPQKATRARRKHPARGGSGEIGFGETEGPGRMDHKTSVFGSVEEVDRVFRVVLVINCDNEGRDGGHVPDQLGGTFDHNGLVGVISCDRAARVRSEVPRLSGAPTRAEPERL